jgi:heme-degrading monooxygenase HmoA
MICTAGIWVVREGREDDFARRWQQSADAIALDYPDVKFRLLRDHENRQRFVSFGEGWRTIEEVEAVRSSPSFQDSMASIWRLLDSGDMSTLDLVADVS